MKYEIVFDVVQSGYRQWWFPAFGFIFIAIGTAATIYRRYLPPRTPTIFPFAFLSFALLWTLGSFAVTFGDYLSLSSALRNGRCAVIQGVVTEFDPMPAGGHKSESFVVAGQRFAYSDYTVTAGFNNAQSHGGPIHEGIQVRIHHHSNEIARLEISR